MTTAPRRSESNTKPLRRISYVETESGQRIVFLTNHFGLPAPAVTPIYKSRWRIVPSRRRQTTLFFKWIKQNLRIKAFFGTLDTVGDSR